ncbi:hypothetical protein MARVELLAND_56 [Bacillus phage vB_BspM_MarvelLand]|nr:hypothetical protein MARVELLAND_56 [Bacillus phage vB_BspM_MarvelLand]
MEKFEPGVAPWVGVVSLYGKKWYGVGSVERCRKEILDK